MRVAIACLLLTAGHTAFAQRVSGRVHTTDGGAPVSGAVVTALAAGGTSLARTLTGRNGEYILNVPASAVRLRSIRIGYRPSTITLAGPLLRDTTLDIAMERQPVVLQTVRIAAEATCNASGDGAFVLEMWDQARAALLAAIVAREAKPARVTLLNYVKRTNVAQNLIVQQRVTSTSGTSTRPIAAARPAAELAANGYRYHERRDAIYYAPDADVLFDDTFSASHCFGLVNSGPDRPGQIGLTFTPRSTERPDFVDVQGILWMTRQNPELVQLEFHYTGVAPEAARAGNGGSMRFRTMSNGVVFIESWSIVIPILELTVDRSFPVRGTPSLKVREMSETGGFVTAAAWSDGERWLQPMGGVRGQVRETGTNAGVAGVSITVTGTATAETDSTGSYSIMPLPPGRYEIKITDTTFSALVKARELTDIIEVTAGDTVTRYFEVPQRVELVASKSRGVAKDPMEAFARREQAGGEGRFIGGDQLRKKDGMAMSSVLRSLDPSIHIDFYRGGEFARSRSAGSLSDPLLDQRDPNSPRGCWANIYLDGVRIYDGPPLSPPNINSFSVASLSDIESYSSTAWLPQKFKTGKNTCATLLLWSRTR